MLINGGIGGIGGLGGLNGLTGLGGLNGGVLPVGGLGGLGGGLIGRRRRSVTSNEKTNDFQHRFHTALQKFDMY